MSQPGLGEQERGAEWTFLALSVRISESTTGFELQPSWSERVWVRDSRSAAAEQSSISTFAAGHGPARTSGTDFNT